LPSPQENKTIFNNESSDVVFGGLATMVVFTTLGPLALRRWLSPGLLLSDFCA